MASWKMAEHVVSQAIERLYELLGRGGASPEVAELGAELKQIRNCLISRSYDLGDPVENDQSWLASLTQLAYQVCDVAELEFSSPSSSSSLANAFRVPGSGFRARTKSIRRRTREILEIAARQAGGTYNSAAEIAGGGRRRDDTGDVIVGRDEDARKLMDKLMAEGDQVSHISIVGMGGLGKTTLAKMVFEHREVSTHFDCHVWVHMSSKYEPREFLFEVLVQTGFRRRYRSEKGMGKSDGHRQREIFSKEDKKVREILMGLVTEELILFVRAELEDKRFLVVVDDVWGLDVWDTVKYAFPNGKNGSKIIFTTRNMGVAHEVDGHVHQPKLLSLENCLELLSLKAFGRDLHCPSDFEMLLMEMVHRFCKGLPLLVILLGGLLRTKSSLKGWHEVYHYLRAHTGEDELHDGISKLLELCYIDLPCYLTPCFLYFVCFPENYEIPKRKLIRLWIAEGFIPKPRREGETMEDIAEGYLSELISRCMVEFVKRDQAGFGFKTCQVHDLVRDFCVMEATKCNFFNTGTSYMSDRTESLSFATNKCSFCCKAGSDSSANSRLHRIVVEDASNLGKIQVCRSHTRSLLWFAATNLLPILDSQSVISMKNFRLLRVLELGFISNRSYGDKPTKLPREIGNLVNLRYLGLKNVLISKLPRSIGNLRYLYTLDLRGNELQSLPKTISRLTCLRYLLLPSVLSYLLAGPNWNRSLFRMDKLKNLHTLKFIEATALIRCDAVLRLTNIRNLKIEFRSNQEVRAVLASPIVEQNRLQSLHMYLLSKDAFPSLESLSGCYNLRKLGLHGTLNEEDLRFLPQNLSKLLFSKSSMKQDPMAVLQEMPSLSFLRLGKNSYDGTEMACLSGGFCNLETLQLVGLSKLRKWRVESGSMPRLATLDIENTPMTLPEEVKFLPCLRDLKITELRETNRDEPREEVDPAQENLDRVGRLKPSATFSSSVGNMPPNISVHLIIAEISSAYGY